MIAACVLDASVALAWVLPGEADNDSDDALERISAGEAVVPGLWRLEIANTLLNVEQRRRISANERHAHLEFFASLPITVDAATSERAWSATIDVAGHHGLSAYDASYLELAVRSGLPLASRDKAMRRVAHTFGLPILG